VKVLFDTNIYVSDAIFGGAASRAVTATVAARWKVFVCQTILTEVHRVIHTKFSRSQAFAKLAVQAVRDIAELTDEPMSRHRVEGDPDDAPILRAAIGAGVDYFVTADKKLLALSPADGVRIITLAEFVEILRVHGLIRD
jgi:putative PIN family toxin of toxin-antitoxin system